MESEREAKKGGVGFLFCSTGVTDPRQHQAAFQAALDKTLFHHLQIFQVAFSPSLKWPLFADAGPHPG